MPTSPSSGDGQALDQERQADDHRFRPAQPRHAERRDRPLFHRRHLFDRPARRSKATTISMPSRRARARPTARAASTGSSSIRRSTIPIRIRRRSTSSNGSPSPSPPISSPPATAICSPSRRWSQPEVLAKFSKEQLDAMQWDTFDERLAEAVEFDIVPQYDKLYDIYTAAVARAAEVPLTSRYSGRPRTPRSRPRTIAREARYGQSCRCAALARVSAAKIAVEGVDSRHPEGEFFTIVGPSGSGKSTLIRMLAGLEEPTSGDILLRGRASTTCRPTVGRPHGVPVAGTVQSHDGRREHRVRADHARRGSQTPGARARRALMDLVRLPRDFYREVGARTAPAASASASRWPARSPPTPRSCSSTSRFRRSTTVSARSSKMEMKDLHRADRQDLHLHHPQPRRGDGDERPHRRDARGTDRAGRRAAGDLSRSQAPASSLSSWGR